MEIKEGSLCLIVKSATGMHVGSSLTTKKYIGTHELFPKYNDLWETDRDFVSRYGVKHHMCPEQWLIPIGKKNVSSLKKEELQTS